MSIEAGDQHRISLTGRSSKAITASTLLRRPRVGHIEFLNCFPLLWGLAKTGSLLDLELIKDTPDNLSDALASGGLDISPISLVELLKNAEDLMVLPDIAIGSDGPVMSCLIISRLPLSQLDKLPVALCSTSRTSVRLAEILLSDLVGVQPEYFFCPPDLAAIMEQAPAAVVIGDTALQALYEASRLSLEVHDLGQMWHDWTGLPFVFAVFAARREFAEHEPEMVRRVHADLLQARDLSLAKMDQVCEQAARWEAFDAATLKHYYTTALDFTLGDRQLAGIAEFTRMVAGRHDRLKPPGFSPQVQLRLLPKLDRPKSTQHLRCRLPNDFAPERQERSMNGLGVDISLAAAVHKLSRHSPDRTAIVYEGRSIRYGELAGAAGRLAMVLADGGVGRGDRVAYIGLNSPTFLTTFLAATWIGAVFVPVNFRLAADEVRQVLDHSSAHTLVVEAGHRALVDLAVGRIPVRRRLLVDDDPAVPIEDQVGPQWAGLSAAVAAGATPGDPQPCHEQDLAMLAYTSGTTGQAKGVAISHGSLWWNGANLDCVADTRADDVNLVVGPLFHTAPLGCFTLRSLARGGTSVVRRSFDAAQTLADLVELRVNTFFAVPAMYTAIARLPGFASADLSWLRTAVVAGAPATAALIAEYADRGVLLQQAYGLTETLFSTCLPAAKTRQKIGSVGVALPFTEIRLVEQVTGHELTKPGARGEVCLRGPNVTRGYWNNAAATAAAFDAGGWFHSGDIGYFDVDGCLYIVDRLKDMIIVGGDNVYPAEVERVLVDFPGILDVAVVGVPDETWGELVVAVLSCPDGVLPSLAEIRRFAEPHLASYKLPSRLYAVDALPRNAMGKIDRNAIRVGLATGTFTPTPTAATSPPNWPQRLAGLSPSRQYRLVLRLVSAHIAEMLEESVSTDLAAECKLEDLGLGSLSAVELSNRLSADTGLQLPTTLLFDHPTVGALTQYVCAALTVPSTDHDSATPSTLIGELDKLLAKCPPPGESDQ